MISGRLPNQTVWWLSTDRKKIWIESEDLEQEKFKEKGYNIAHGRIFYARIDVGELTTSRLDSRQRKEAWIIKLEAILNVYPDLVEDIRIKEIEERKKKRTKVSNKNNKKIERKIEISKKPIKDIKENIEEDKNKIVESTKEVIKNETSNEYGHFDANRQYISWIKDEINKTDNGKMIIPINDLKEKMGEEFLKLDNFRIYFGLNKILSGTGIIVELGSAKKECVAIIRKI